MSSEADAAEGGSSPETGPVTALRAALGAGLLVGQQVAAKVVRDAFFLSEFPVTTLPLALAAGAAISLIAVAALSRVTARRHPGAVVRMMLWSSAFLLALEWALSLGAPRAAAALVYLHVATFGATLVSGYWSLINESFDPHAARKAMGTIGAGASVGGVLGGALTWRASRLVRVPTLLLGLAGLLVLCALALRGIGRSRPAAGRPGPSPRVDAEPARSEPSLAWLARDPYLRALAALMVLCAFVEALLDYAFNAAAAGRFAQGQALAGFFAAFHTFTGLAGLIVQASLVRRSLTRLGLAGTLATHPLVVALLAGVASVIPRMNVMVLLRGAEAVLRNSTFRSSYELLYTPLPHTLKRPAKPWIDVGADRLGTLAGSGATALALVVAGPHVGRALALLATAAALAMLAVTWRFHRAYVTALVESLRRGVVRLEQEEVVDSTTQRAVESAGREEAGREETVPAAAAEEEPKGSQVADLRSSDPVRIRAALALGLSDATAVAAALPLLRRDDLFKDVVPALRPAASRFTGQLVDALLDPAVDPVIRRRAARVLASAPTRRAADGLLAGLECERFDVRYRSGAALLRLRQRAGLAVPADRAFAAAQREMEELGGHADPIRLDHVFTILALAREGEPIDIARRAVRGHDAALRGTALEYLDQVLPAAIRDALFPLIGAVAAPLPARRGVMEVRDELIRSSWRWTHDRSRRSSRGR